MEGVVKRPVSMLYRVTDGGVYQPSLRDQIRRAKTREVVEELLGGPMFKLASPGTRRKCLAVAESRLATLRVEALHGT